MKRTFISRPTSSFSIHYILAGKVDLIKMSKYRGARDCLKAQDLFIPQNHCGGASVQFTCDLVLFGGIDGYVNVG